MFLFPCLVPRLSGPPVVCDYTPKGTIAKIGDVETYFVGTSPVPLFSRLVKCFRLHMETRCFWYNVLEGHCSVVYGINLTVVDDGGMAESEEGET